MSATVSLLIPSEIVREIKETVAILSESGLPRAFPRATPLSTLSRVSPQVEKQAQIYDAGFQNSHMLLAAEHPLVRTLTLTLRSAAKMVGIDPQAVKLQIFMRYPRKELEDVLHDGDLEGYLPEAFVNPLTGVIYLSQPLFEALDYDQEEVNAILFHELGHLILERGLPSARSETIYDPLGQRLLGYEHEYHCDRLAALIASLRGESPTSIGQALSAIQRYSEERIEILPAEERAWLFEFRFAALGTHPNTKRRIRANELLSRHLIVAKRFSSILLPVLASEGLDLSFERPYGDVFGERNSFGRELESGQFLEGDWRPPLDWPYPNTIESYQVLFNDKQEPWAKGEALDVCMPPCLLDVVEEVSASEEAEKIRKLSDWFGEVQLYLLESCFHPEAIQLIYEDLEQCDAHTVADILISINAARFTRNSDEVGYEAVGHEMCAAVSMVANRIVSERKEAEVDDFSILQEMFGLADVGSMRFGYSVLEHCPEMYKLVESVFRNGDDARRTELIALLDSNRCVTWSILRFEPQVRAPGSLLNQLSAYAQAENLTFLRPREERDRLENRLHEVTGMWRFKEWGFPALVVRREAGAEYSVTLKAKENEEPEIEIKFGDAPPGEAGLSRVWNLFDEYFSRRGVEEMEEIEREESEESEVATLRFLRRQVREAIECLSSGAAPTTEVQRDFMEHELGPLFEQESGLLTARAMRQARDGSEQAMDAGLGLSLEDYVTCHGSDQAYAEFAGTRRERHDLTSYCATEQEILQLRQINELFDKLYGQTFQGLPSGIEKLSFLRQHYPCKTLSRDRLIVTALDYPRLDYLDDFKAIHSAINKEDRLDVLVALRDTFSNPIVSLAAENRLFQLYESDPQILLRPVFVREKERLAGELPDGLKEEVFSNERFLAVLCSYQSRSRVRDRAIREFLDRAGSESVKNAIAGLLVDSIIADLSANIRPEGERRASLDTLADIVALTSPFEKAQGLLYFLGERRFSSPLKVWLEDPHSEWEKLHDGTTLPLVADQPGRARKVFSLPDIIVRAQKGLGVSVETAIALQGSVGTERASLDFLWDILNGQTGIKSNSLVSKEFFHYAGKAIVEHSSQLSRHPPETRREVSKFLAFALRSCPDEKLPALLLKIWEASRKGEKDAPVLVCEVLQGLGAAFVKFGQRMAALDVDSDWKRAFRQLCSQNSQADSSLLYHNLRVLYRGNSPFDHEKSGRKIAEGSMAASYVTALRQAEGEQPEELYALKVIHPFIRDEIETDVAFIAKLVGYINQHPDLFGNLSIPTNTPGVVREQLSCQIDTEAEIGNAASLKLCLARGSADVFFEAVECCPGLSVPGTVATRYRPGYELDYPVIGEQGIDAERLRNAVGLELLRQILFEPFYQSDPNLGNFGVLHDSTGRIVLRDGKPTIVWYDSGSVMPIAGDDQKKILRIIRAIYQEPEKLPVALVDLVKGTEDPQRRSEVLEKTAHWLAGIQKGGSEGLRAVEGYLTSFFDFLIPHGLEVEEKWLGMANTISGAAPLLKGAPETALSTLVLSAFRHHGMLSRAERALTYFLNR